MSLDDLHEKDVDLNKYIFTIYDTYAAICVYFLLEILFPIWKLVIYYLFVVLFSFFPDMKPKRHESVD